MKPTELHRDQLFLQLFSVANSSGDNLFVKSFIVNGFGFLSEFDS